MSQNDLSFNVFNVTLSNICSPIMTVVVYKEHFHKRQDLYYEPYTQNKKETIQQ